jgi:hypothetical protein
MKFIAYVILVSLISLSCGKNPANSITSPKLKQFKIAYASPNSQGDSAAYFSFTKDNNDRVTNFFGYYSDSGTINPQYIILDIDFTYNGASILPDIAYIKKSTFSPGVKHYYTYNQNQQLAKDSVIVRDTLFIGNYT